MSNVIPSGDSDERSELGIGFHVWDTFFIAQDSFARCAPSPAYQTTFEVVSCEDVDPVDHWGVILEVNVFSKKRTGNPGNYDWWSDNAPLPKKMHVFYETKEKTPCAALKRGTKRKGAMRELCCDGAEPRCKFSSIQVYDLKK
jgi:hypothetical protein